MSPSGVCASLELLGPLPFPRKFTDLKPVSFFSRFATMGRATAGRSMEVDTAHLHAGADRCNDAAQTALAAAAKLAGKEPAVGMFGDFAEAHEFHEAVSTAHRGHIEQLHGHHRALTEISGESHSAADEFTARDTSTADTFRAAEAGFDTL